MTLHTIQWSHKGEKKMHWPENAEVIIGNHENDDKAFCTENYVLKTIHSIEVVI